LRSFSGIWAVTLMWQNYQVNVGVPIDQLELRGAGVFLMKKVMDEVIFEFQESKGTVLTMIKKKSG